MAGASIDVSDLIDALEAYPYLVSYNGNDLAPLAGAPSVEADTDKHDVTLYETGSDPQASYVTKNNVNVTINTRNVAEALTLLQTVKKGDNLLDSTKEHSLVFTPITSDTGAKIITFAHACLDVGFGMTAGENEEPNAFPLRFICKADETTGLPFALSAVS